MFLQLTLLLLLCSLQPGRLQCYDVSTMLHNIESNLLSLNTFIRTHYRSMSGFRAQVEREFNSLKGKFDFLNQSVSNFSMCLQEHKEQTATELSHLQASLTSTHSKLDTLTNTTASDRQQIVDSMSDVECMDNLTHQLENTQENVTINEHYTCGGTGGWRRVVYLDMTNPNTTCPSGWNMTGYSKRTCGRVGTGERTCDSATFPISGGEYGRVCGRIKAYQYGAPDAFFAYHNRHATTIDGAYVCGVSATHGTPRNHIWTFANGAAEGSPTQLAWCPCDANNTIRVPPFVDNDYFCESGVNEPFNAGRHYTFHPDDTLWDGEDCLPSSTCCSLHNPPYFVKQLSNKTTDGIEARICLYNDASRDNIAVELVELYVQ